VGPLDSTNLRDNLGKNVEQWEGRTAGSCARPRAGTGGERRSGKKVLSLAGLLLASSLEGGGRRSNAAISFPGGLKVEGGLGPLCHRIETQKNGGKRREKGATKTTSLTRGGKKGWKKDCHHMQEPLGRYPQEEETAIYGLKKIPSCCCWRS